MSVVLDHAWCDLDGAARSIEELTRLTVRAGFAPVIFLGEQSGDALCEAALNAGACAAVGRNEDSSEALLAAIGGAAALQSHARAQRHHSGQLVAGTALQWRAHSRLSTHPHPGHRALRRAACGRK